MQSINQFYLEIIALAGTARSNFIEAVNRANTGEENSDHLLEEGTELLNEAIQKWLEFNKKDKAELDLMLLYAESTLMGAESFRIIAKQQLKLIDRVKELESAI